jgi:DNA-binding transcriptional MerR regulator
MTQVGISIGKAGELTRVKVPTIRYYEDIGLLPVPPRTNSNRRMYNEGDIRRIKFIRHARELGFRLEAIRQLLAIAGLPDEPCDEADEIARARLADIKDRIIRLTALRQELEEMIETDAHGIIRNCRVIEVLAGHDGFPTP